MKYIIVNKIYWGDFIQGDFVLGGFYPRGDFVLIPLVSTSIIINIDLIIGFDKFSAKSPKKSFRNDATAEL